MVTHALKRVTHALHPDYDYDDDDIVHSYFQI